MFVSRSAKMLLAAAAVTIGMGHASVAADMPMKAQRGTVLDYVDWGGLYVGLHLGAGWGNVDATATAGPPLGPFGPVTVFSATGNGFIGGGQIGYNVQSGMFVYGIQGDISGSGISGKGPCGILAFPIGCSFDVNWIATVTGRIGGLVNDRLLVYLKGGGAWLDADYAVSGIVAAPFAVSQSTTVGGWVLGFGTEYKFSRNLSAFIEYNYMDFGKNTETFVLSAAAAGVAGGQAISFEHNDVFHTVKAGVNYMFWAR
jgi:outer membrane immunogenic protein